MTNKLVRFGGEKLRVAERKVLETIDASRVRTFMDTVASLMPVNKLANVTVEELEEVFELPFRQAAKRDIAGHFQGRKKSDLLWAGMTVEGLGVAFIGTGTTEKDRGIRKVPEVGIVADPDRDRILLLDAELTTRRASDGWNSGWSLDSYRATDWDKEVGVLKPVDEHSYSRIRGYYDVSLMHDPHFMYGDQLHRAAVMFNFAEPNGIQAMLGQDIVTVEGSSFPVYNFQSQITPNDTVRRMSHLVLRAHATEL